MCPNDLGITMIYLNNVQQVYNTQLGSNNPPRPKIQNRAFQLWRKREKTLSIILDYSKIIIVKRQKTSWNTLVEILRLRRPNHSKTPYQHILLQTLWGHGHNYSKQKLTSQNWLDTKTDQLIHWKQTFIMFVKWRLLS